MFVCIQYPNLYSMFKLFKVEDTFLFDQKLTTQLSISNRITRFVQFSFTGVIFFSYKMNEFEGNRVQEGHCFENRNSFSITHRIVIKLNNKKTLYQAFINMWTSMAKNVIDKIAASSWLHFTLKNPPPPPPNIHYK